MTRVTMARILIVDDPIYVRALVRRVADGAGHEVVGEAGTGRDALEQFALTQPDLAIVDIVMPGMDGLGVVERNHRVVPAARLLVHSAYSHEEKMREALQAGATAYLAKSPDSTRLANAIEYALTA